MKVGPVENGQYWEFWLVMAALTLWAGQMIVGFFRPQNSAEVIVKSIVS